VRARGSRVSVVAHLPSEWWKLGCVARIDRDGRVFLLYEPVHLRCGEWAVIMVVSRMEALLRGAYIPVVCRLRVTHILR
jgi:hypothetical protein